MNQEIKPLTAIIILLVFGGLLLGKFWSHGEALSVFTFSHMHKHPDGTAYIMLDNQLYGFDSQAQPTGRLDLSRIGIDSGMAITDFAFFANGDLLIHRNFKPFGFIHSLQRYLRFENLQPKTDSDTNNGLHRCNMQTYQCQPFSNPPLNLNDTFTLTIDWQTDRVFIADTSRSTLYLYSGTGTELDSKQGFYFPNQIQFKENQLYVADTNHQALVRVNVDGDRFGALETILQTFAHPYSSEGEAWPSAFLLMENQRWVRNADNNMEYGGIYLFDNQKGFIKRLALPKGADLFALMQLGNTVLVNDFDLGKIYQFSLDGEALPDFSTEVFQPLLDKLQAQKQFYRNLDLGFTLAFALCLLTGFGLALFQKRTAGSAMPIQETLAVVPDNLAGQQIHWLKLRFKFRAYLIFMSLFLMGLQVLVLFVDHLEGWTLTDSLLKNYNVFLIFIFSIIFLLFQFKRKIGISDDYLVIVPPIGKAVFCRKEQLLYSDLLVLAGDSRLNLGQLPKMFTEEDIDALVYPAIRQGRHIGNTEMQGLLMRKKSTRAIVIVSVILLVALFVYLGITTERIV